MKEIRIFYRRFGLYIGLILIISFLGCEKNNDDPPVFKIEGLTTENYPRVDGSTSTEPLQILIACKLFGIGYDWRYYPFSVNYSHRIVPSCESNPDLCKFLSERIRHSGTHSAFENLINNHTDLILVARMASRDERDLANRMGIELIETPVALDALVFLNNIDNPVRNLTTPEIIDIYMGKISNWSDVGGGNTRINPYRREANSGSQELMDELVMKNLEMPMFPEMIVFGMMGLINRIEYDPDGLGYSVYYYTQYMTRNEYVKQLKVDGYFPDSNSIKSRDYRYTANVYAVIRKDLQKTSEAYRLYDMLLKNAGQKVIEESGYVPFY